MCCLSCSCAATSLRGLCLFNGATPPLPTLLLLLLRRLDPQRPTTPTRAVSKSPARGARQYSQVPASPIVRTGSRGRSAARRTPLQPVNTSKTSSHAADVPQAKRMPQHTPVHVKRPDSRGRTSIPMLSSQPAARPRSAGRSAASSKPVQQQDASVSKLPRSRSGPRARHNALQSLASATAAAGMHSDVMKAMASANCSTGMAAPEPSRTQASQDFLSPQARRSRTVQAGQAQETPFDTVFSPHLLRKSPEAKPVKEPVVQQQQQQVNAAQQLAAPVTAAPQATAVSQQLETQPRTPEVCQPAPAQLMGDFMQQSTPTRPGVLTFSPPSAKQAPAVFNPRPMPVQSPSNGPQLETHNGRYSFAFP